MTLKTVYISAAFLAGLFLSFYAYDLMPIMLIICLLVCIASLFASRQLRARILLVAVSFALSVLFYGIYTLTVLKPIENADGEECFFSGKIAETELSDRGQVILKGYIRGRKVKAIAYVGIGEGDIGDRVSFSAKVSKLESEGIFDERSYYLPDGIYLSLSPTSPIEITKATSLTLSERLMLYSRECSLKVRQLAGGEEGDFITAMSTGNDKSLSPALKRSLNRVGIGHVTSVSGLHISVVAALVLFLFKKLRLNHSICALSAIIPIAAYVVYSGGAVSAVRSAVMMCMYIVATLFMKRAHRLNTLSLCALLMVLPNPYLAADSSFILSLSGIFAVGVAAPKICSALKIRSGILSAVITSCTAWLITTPALMLYFDEFSILSPITNLTLPLSSAAMVLTLIYVLFGCSPLLSFLPKAAGYLVKPILWMCRLIGDKPYSALPVLSDGIVAVAAFLAMGALLLCLMLGSRKRKALAVLITPAIFMSIYSVSYGLSQQDMTLHIINSGGDSVCLITSGNSGLILDLDKGFRLSYESSRVAARSGVTEIKLATSKTNGEAAYAEYSQMAIPPERLYLSEKAYIFGGDIPTFSREEVTVIDFGKARILLCGEDIRITKDGKAVVISKGLANGSISISVFDGTVVVGGERFTEELISLPL